MYGLDEENRVVALVRLMETPRLGLWFLGNLTEHNTILNAMRRNAARAKFVLYYSH